MPILPVLGKLIIKYAVPVAVEKIISLAWNRFFKKKKKENAHE